MTEGHLLDLLRGDRRNFDQYWAAIETISMSCGFCHESFEIGDEPLNRIATLKSIKNVLTYVQRMLEKIIQSLNQGPDNLWTDRQRGAGYTQLGLDLHCQWILNAGEHG